VGFIIVQLKIVSFCILFLIIYKMKESVTEKVFIFLLKSFGFFFRARVKIAVYRGRLAMPNSLLIHLQF
jgi:hypothetical protein